MNSTPEHLTTSARDPLRVLFVAHSFPRYEGDGAGAFILRLAVALRERGIEVRALAPSAPELSPTADLRRIPVTRFRYAPAALETLAYSGTMIAEAKRTAGATMLSFLAAERRAIRREALAHRANVVHAHWWFPSGLAAAGATNGALVTTMHGTDVRVARSKVARPALRRVMRRSAAATTVSRWLADEVRRLAPGSNPHVAPMPAATELFSPGGERDFGLIVFVGRLNEQKGARHLISAFARMEHRARLRIIGDGPDAESLRRQASELAADDRIEWLAPLPQHALAQHYRQAGVVAVPSIEEGLGMVAVEAQLCGAAVVASRSGGLPDVVEDGRSGLLVPPAEPDALALALDRLVANPDVAARLGVAGREAALRTFSPEAVAERYEGIYRQALDAR